MSVALKSFICHDGQFKLISSGCIYFERYVKIGVCCKVYLLISNNLAIGMITDFGELAET